MPKGATRRNFLKVAGVGAAAIAHSASSPGASLLGASIAGSPTGELKMWVTDEDRRLAAAPPIAWSDPVSEVAQDSILIRPENKFQPILGFGAALTDGSCYLFNQLSPMVREELFHTLFHPSEMALNVCRTCIGSSDHSTSVYSFDDGEPDPELKRFSIEHDRAYILPMLRQARQVNPDLFLFSSPWSPPGWMKDNGSMLGGCMRHTYMPSYANYFVKFLQAYAAEGVPVQALTSQNELDTDQDGRMPACIWPQEYEIQFVRDHLGPLLEKSGTKTKIWILDHNYNLWGRAICSLEDEKLREYVNAVAFHGYYGTPDMMSKVQQAFPEIEMHWTEGGPDYTDPGYLVDWCKWGVIFSDVLRNWCRSITAWNLALDERGHPNIGPFPCGGIVSIHSQTKEITRSGQYWAFAHYSRAIRRGARRFDSHSSVSDLHHVAAENPDGRQILIVTNPGAGRTIELRLANLVAPISLKTNSVTTLAWK